MLLPHVSELYLESLDKIEANSALMFFSWYYSIRFIKNLMGLIVELLHKIYFSMIVIEKSFFTILEGALVMH